MKKFLNSLYIFAAVVFCLAASVSCKKMEIIGGGKTALNFTIKSVGYFYNASREGYDILFVDVPDFDFESMDYLPYNNIGVDLHKSLLGTHDLTENLDTQSWSFYFYLSYTCYYTGDFESGSMTLNIDEEADTIVFKIDGILKETGQHIRANYSGPAQKVSDYMARGL